MFLTSTTIMAFAFGAVVGSFLNVVIYRVPLGLSVVRPASRCPSCQTPIRWYDNIPILSWALLLRAKCRQCKSPISARYALVEALMGVLAALIWARYAWEPLTRMTLPDPSLLGALAVPALMYFVFVSFLVVIAFIDLDHLIIPHEISVPGILLGVASPWVLRALYTPRELLGHWPPLEPAHSLVGMLAGAGLVVSIFVLYFILRGIPGMGGGDVTLMALVGAWLGWPALFFVFMASSLQGLLAAGVGTLTGASFVRDAHDIFEEDERAAREAQAARQATAGQPDTAADQDAHADHAPAQDATTQDATTQDAPQADAQAPTQGEQDGPGPAAIPFGPFIVLAALEYYLLGPWLPEALSMASLYGF